MEDLSIIHKYQYDLNGIMVSSNQTIVFCYFFSQVHWKMFKFKVTLNKICIITQFPPFILNRNINSFGKAATLIPSHFFSHQWPHIKLTHLPHNLFNWLKTNTL